MADAGATHASHGEGRKAAAWTERERAMRAQRAGPQQMIHL
jgi:hypothetical protein